MKIEIINNKDNKFNSYNKKKNKKNLLQETLKINW